MSISYEFSPSISEIPSICILQLEMRYEQFSYAAHLEMTS